jgi:hypothetical protein
MFSRSAFASFALVLSTLTSVSFAQNTSQDMYAQVFTNWIVSVNDNDSAKECAKTLAYETGLKVTSVFETIGVFVVETPSADGTSIGLVSCVAAYEQEGTVSAQ